MDHIGFELHIKLKPHIGLELTFLKKTILFVVTVQHDPKGSTLPSAQHSDTNGL